MPEAYTKDVKHVLTILWDADETIILNKLELFSNDIKYLGQGIHPGPLALPQYRIDRICNFKHTRNTTELLSFLCLCSVFGCFVPCFVRNTVLLNRRWGKNNWLASRNLLKRNHSSSKQCEKSSAPLQFCPFYNHLVPTSWTGRLRSPNWACSPAIALRGVRQAERLLVKISQQLGARLRISHIKVVLQYFGQCPCWGHMLKAPNSRFNKS